MISAIITIVLTFGTPGIKTAPFQPALHTKTTVYDITSKKRK